MGLNNQSYGTTLWQQKKYIHPSCKMNDVFQNEYPNHDKTIKYIQNKNSILHDTHVVLHS